ncbi:MAG: hypothetical protein NPIRA04_33620 [Nitrospirales bacterium]|nr:MAG: hypothetical protein NPIRA04_33620 [Nitrospirales bacterium]
MWIAVPIVADVMKKIQLCSHAALFPVVSIVIIVFLVAQLVAIILPVPFYYWPFLDYPMYSKTRVENELVNENLELVGIVPDGRERRITRQELGLSFFKFNDWLIPRLRDNQNDPSIQVYVEILRAIDHGAFQSIRIQAAPVRISRAGISEAPIQVFRVVDLQSIGGG